VASDGRIRRAFTLLELLIVVAILALLSSMLVPSLSAARQSAKAVKCSGQLRSLAQAAITYSLEHGDAIPGSPLTSGMHFTQTPGNEVWKAGDSVCDWYDFAGAILPLFTRAVPKNRTELIGRLTRDVFECPGNQETYGPYPQSEDYPVIRSVSYLTMNTFMRAGGDTYDRYRKDPPPGLAVDEVWKVAWPNHSSVRMPGRYTPRFERVGRSSQKVLLADGFRYFDPPSTKDYCVWQKSFAGNQSAQPPCDIESREYGEMNAAGLSYRHGRKDAINAAFFDGHVEALAKKESHRPELYFPSGSVVADESGFYTEWRRGNDLVLP